MKRKKTVPAEVVPKPVNDAAPVPEKDHPLYDRLFVVGFAVLLFFAMTVQTVPMSLILAAVALALSFGRGGYARFRGRLGIPVLGFLAFLILCGAASLYTSFGAYAYGEYAKLLASGALGLLLLARGREQNAGGLLFSFSAVCGVIGLLCIDAGCRGPLFRGFASFMEGLGDAAYQSLDQATYTGARFDGIYNDANLTGSLMALAVLVGLYLIRTGRKPWERFAACFLTGLSAVAFFYRDEPWCHSLLWRDSPLLSVVCGKRAAGPAVPAPVFHGVIHGRIRSAVYDAALLRLCSWDIGRVAMRTCALGPV